MSLDQEKINKSSKEFELGVFRASVDSLLSILKAMIILNAGALVSILIAASRSVTEGFASAVIGSAYHFFWGLIFAIIAMIFFTPDAALIDDSEEVNVAQMIPVVIMALSLLVSIVLFFYGSWSTISNLQELFHIE